MYTPSLSFEENVIFNNHKSDMAKDYVESTATKAKRQVGKGSKNRHVYDTALNLLEDKGFIGRWTTPKGFKHYSVITEFGLNFQEDSKGLTIWVSNNWNGLPPKFGDTLTFLILSTWRYDRNLRSQQLEVMTNLDHLFRRFGGHWPRSEIAKRIDFLRRNGNLNGEMLSDLTFSKKLEEGYINSEMR
jgi:hypothetical protein